MPINGDAKDFTTENQTEADIRCRAALKYFLCGYLHKSWCVCDAWPIRGFHTVYNSGKLEG